MSKPLANELKSATDGVSRRTHRKSRFGCKVCKQRRIKCDERRPSCGNCTKSHQQCSYLALSAALPSSASASASALSVAVSSSSSPSPRHRWPHPPTSLLSPSDSPREPLLYPAGESYNLCHLELLHHFLCHKSDVFHDSQQLAKDYSDLTVKLGFASPFLMDETLAVAAAHKSTTLQGASRDFHHREATQLQTRALAQFNAIQPVIGEQGSLSVFLFSALLGLHVFFDTFSSQTDFSTILDRFVHCLGLHRGIRTIVSRSMSSILAEVREHLGPDSAMIHDMEPADRASERGDECALLTVLIRRSDLGPVAAEAYGHAVDALQQLFDRQRNPQISSHRRCSVVQEWPVRVPEDYVDLLAQRRPEALIILAYYAMLLHNARLHWAVAGAGRFLIQSITTHLGPYWAEWLDTPNKMLKASEPYGI